MDISKLSKDQKSVLKIILEQQKNKLLKKQEEKLNNPTKKESLKKLASGQNLNTQDSLNLMEDIPKMTPKNILKQESEKTDQDKIKRYEELIKDRALSKALRNQDPSQLNAVDMIRYNELQEIITGFSGGATPPANVINKPNDTGSAPPNTNQSIVDKKSKQSTKPITFRQENNTKKSVRNAINNSNQYTDMEKGPMLAKWMEKFKNGEPVKLRHLPPTDPNFNKTGIYSGFGDPFDINNWEIQ